MTEQGDLLARIDRLLNDAGVAHMVVGSLASSFHGEPRQTRDIDIVIGPDGDGVRRFLALLDQDAFYADEEAASEALERRTSFNVIERETGWKVDLILQKDRPFSVEELRRRVRARVLGTDTHVASAEDTVMRSSSGQWPADQSASYGTLAAFSGRRVKRWMTRTWSTGSAC